MSDCRRADETATFAESTHEVSVDEWSAVQVNVYAFPDLLGAIIGHRTDAGAVVYLSAQVIDGVQLQLCSDDSFKCASVPLKMPILTQTTLDSGSVLVAMVASGTLSPELHVTHSDGTVDIHVLFQPTSAIPGPAVAVFQPDDFKSAELLVDGQVVASR